MGRSRNNSVLNIQIGLHLFISHLGLMETRAWLASTEACGELVCYNPRLLIWTHTTPFHHPIVIRDCKNNPKRYIFSRFLRIFFETPETLNAVASSSDILMKFSRFFFFIYFFVEGSIKSESYIILHGILRLGSHSWVRFSTQLLDEGFGR